VRLAENMVQTLELVPAPPLQDYIRCYNLRQFDTKGEEMRKAIPAVPGMFLSFWLSAAPVHLVTGDKITPVNVRERQLLGMQSGYIGHLAFSGRYQLLGIEFKGGGFHRIFGLPAREITDELLEGDAVLGSRMGQLQEQFQAAGSYQELKELADSFFLDALFKNQTAGDLRIDKVLHHISDAKAPIDIEWLAEQANMSLRSFEQKFTEQVGLTPKLYSRILRFNHALALKIAMPEKKWTTIAHTCGYYDQMHFIKDFKTFAGSTPNIFLRQLPAPKEEIVVRS